ncbi:DUF2199 domain-containing protein [Nakamurella sp. YIM 132087]|uniref:DUF2199 domain-containing protein n=1 Tax=Nakamurella alba TaxID=2665158 RepID=A0A7K1FLP0_9ACTN|nr:DUF2199 domain-containing protein [Nakamurella alba]MTD15067.1 DUF2199 domain-containing protein [Nakamurella alba]
MGKICSDCGRTHDDDHDLHVRFNQPDPVLAAGPVDDALVWMSDQTARSSVLMQVQGVGAFVRALLKIELTADHRVTYGVWVAIDPAEFIPVFENWWEPSYKDLRLHGLLANAVPPWGLFAKQVTIAVTDTDSLPYCVDSADQELRDVITGRFDHQMVLAAVPVKT